jgi:hypothetical protein
MVLTQGCVNAVAIGIVTVAVARLWRGARARRAREAEEAGSKERVSSVDAYLLLEHTRENLAEVGRSEMCGCLYCEQLYRPAEIAAWVEETAVCPRCGRTSVVGSGAGIALTRELLHRSHAVWAGADDGRALRLTLRR